MQEPFQHYGPWRHVKTGGIYQALERCTIEADRTPAILYRDEDSRLWVRPEAEFFDGRFEPVIEWHFWFNDDREPTAFFVHGHREAAAMRNWFSICRKQLEEWDIIKPDEELALELKQCWVRFVDDERLDATIMHPAEPHEAGARPITGVIFKDEKGWVI